MTRIKSEIATSFVSAAGGDKVLAITNWARIVACNRTNSYENYKHSSLRVPNPMMRDGTMHSRS